MSKKKTSKKGTAKRAKKGAAEKREAKAKQPRKAKATDKRVGALDAAAEVLRKGGEPMRCPDLIAAMTEHGLWTSPAGKTPHATLYAAIHREIANKGDAARFKKVERGLFAINA